MADPVAAAKVKAVNELRGAIAKDVISGNASATLAAAGGTKSWSKMSTSERMMAYEMLKKDLNRYLGSKFGISTTVRPEIVHVRTVRCRA